MASRDMYPALALRPENVFVFGSFVPNGSSAIDNTANEGSGSGGSGLFSVARSATGNYTVTMADPYSAIVFADAELQSLTAQAVHMQVVSKTSNTVVFGAESSGSFADIAAAAGTRVQFMAVCRNTSIV